MKVLRRDDKFRFSLQWSADTEEKAKVGSLLEQMGNKKSDFIVIAIAEYLQRHPEMAVSGSKIEITYPTLHTKEQLLEMVRDMVKSSMSEFMQGRAVVPSTDNHFVEMPSGPSEQDIDAMVASLKLFDQS